MTTDVREIVPGLWTIPVQIPIPGLATVNVYAFQLRGGDVALVDTGWDDDQSYASLVAGLARCGLRLDGVRTVLVTHAHPDHLGLARRIQEESGAEVLMHEVEAARLTGGVTTPAGYVAAAREAFPRWGVAASSLEDWVGSSADIRARSWQLDITPVGSGQALDLPGWDLVPVLTPGHTAGHMCLHERSHRLLLSGDHVLPRITPVVGMHPAVESDPLADFLDSLSRVAELDVRLTLPAHEREFADLPARVAELHAHHRARLAEVVDVVAREGDVTAWQVARRLSWSRPLTEALPPTRRLALAETQAHLVHLGKRGDLRRCPAQRSGGPETWATRDATPASAP